MGMTVFISYAREDRDFVQRLTSELKNNNIDAWTDENIVVGSPWNEQIYRAIINADVVLPIITQNYNENYAVGEIQFALAYHKQVLPVLMIPHSDLAPELYSLIRSFQWIFGNSREDLIISRIVSELVAISHKLEEAKKEKEAKEQKIDNSVTVYLGEVQYRLKTNERRNRRIALCLYGVSFAFLALSLLPVWRFSVNGVASLSVAHAVIQGVLELALVAIFVSLSKLLFSIAKSFMVESIRSSDRLHAILFGKFFLNAFGTTVTHDEVFKAFNTWNIDDGKTEFRKQSAEEYDPKLEKYIKFPEKKS